MRKHYTTGEVAEFCGVSLRTVINWIKKGRLNAYQLPGTRGDNRITHESLMAFFNDNGLPVPDSLTQTDEPKRLARSKTLLIVDDDLSMAKAIQRIARSCGLNTVLAHDGFEAGRLYEKHQPEVMTLDLQMPKLNGFDVLNYLKEEQKPVICVISAMADHHLQRAKAIRANHILAKPFEPDELVSFLKNSESFATKTQS